MNRYWLNQMKVPPVLKYGWQKVIWPWVEKNMGNTQIRKDSPNVGVSLTLFYSYLIGRFVSSFPPKKFCFFFSFLKLDFYWQTHSSIARLFFVKIIDNHSSFNMDFMWLVTWPRFKRFWRKRIYRLKNCLLVIIVIIIL